MTLRPMPRAAVPPARSQREVPRWVVTAPYLSPRHAGRRAPWGTTHIRRDNSTLTACGEACVQWYTFWEIPISLARPDVCRTCVETVGAAGFANPRHVVRPASRV